MYTMRNKESLNLKVLLLVEKLPCFSLENLKILDIKNAYLRIILSRCEKNGEFIRLKKGLYTSKNFINNIKIKDRYSDFLEFLSNQIYYPSYLSLDYILYQYNILTEVPVNFTLITKNKTATFSNKLGNFIYHKIKDNLFTGFKITKNNNLIIYKATKIKALFDFLYLRKNLLIDKKSIKELRLNLDDIILKEKKEFKKYVDLEGSKVMQRVYLNFFN